MKKFKLCWTNALAIGLLFFFTIGDNNINAYDVNKYDEISAIQDSGDTDFGTAVERANASFDENLMFNNNIESTAG